MKQTLPQAPPQSSRPLKPSVADRVIDDARGLRVVDRSRESGEPFVFGTVATRGQRR